MWRKSNIPFSILVWCADHLGEIDNYGFPIFTLDEDIEFIVVAMDQASLSETDDDVHQLRV